MYNSNHIILKVENILLNLDTEPFSGLEHRLVAHQSFFLTRFIYTFASVNKKKNWFGLLKRRKRQWQRSCQERDLLYSVAIIWGFGPIWQGQTWQIPVLFIKKWHKEKNTLHFFFPPAVKDRRILSKNTRSLVCMNKLRRKSISAYLTLSLASFHLVKYRYRLTGE